MGKGTGGGRKRDRAYGVRGTARNSAQVAGWSVCSGEEQVEGKGARAGNAGHEGPAMPVRGVWPLPWEQWGSPGLSNLSGTKITQKLCGAA